MEVNSLLIFMFKAEIFRAQWERIRDNIRAKLGVEQQPVILSIESWR